MNAILSLCFRPISAVEAPTDEELKFWTIQPESFNVNSKKSPPESLKVNPTSPDYGNEFTKIEIIKVQEILEFLWGSEDSIVRKLVSPNGNELQNQIWNETRYPIHALAISSARLVLEDIPLKGMFCIDAWYVGNYIEARSQSQILRLFSKCLPIHLAAFCGNLEFCVFLLKNNCEFGDALVADEHEEIKWSVLDCANNSGSYEVIELISCYF